MSLDKMMKQDAIHPDLVNPSGPLFATGNLGVDPALETTPTFRAATRSFSTHLLLRDPSTGANQVRSFNGAKETGRQNLPVFGDANSRVISTGDFNRDGQDDLVWLNSATGATQLWQVNGASIQTFDLPTVTDLDWQIVGASDVNGDSSLDLIWQHVKTQTAGVWLMDGVRFKSAAMIGTATGPGWRVQGVGDFNGDPSELGKANRSPDLVWQNLNTGQTALWLLKGTQLTQGVWLDSAPVDWKIAAVADFNGDRSPDLFWRNDRTGETGFWFYRGTQRTQMVGARSQPANSTVVSAADLNGDQTADLLWRNSTTGEILEWMVENGTVKSTAALLADPNWQAVGVLPSITTTQVGALTSNGSLATAENQTPSFSRLDRVDGTNPSDFYRFSVGQSGVFTANLTGLTGDADVRLIQDANGNGAIDTGEIVAWQWERGTRNESIRRFLNPGTYMVQVLGYNNQAADYTLTTNFTAAASDDQQFRIELNFGNTLNGLSEAARNAIMEAARFWEGIITSRSAMTQSNVLPVTVAGENLTYSDGTADTGTFVLSGPTFTVDAANNLVILRGGSTLNIRKFSEFNANPGYLRDIMIHEFAHVFGFGLMWEPVEFVRSDGTRFTAGKNWIDRSANTYTANSYAGVAYGELLGTFTPTAIPIEPQIFAHWDETRFDAELLTPFAETPGTSAPLSSLTLAALRDLGWNINMGAAQVYALSTARVQAVQSPDNGPAIPGRAAYKCACSHCLTDLSPVLMDAVGDSV
jgi:hypothetical protein